MRKQLFVTGVLLLAALGTRAQEAPVLPAVPQPRPDPTLVNPATDSAQAVRNLFRKRRNGGTAVALTNMGSTPLRAGAVDVGSTAGSAALLARSNGSPIQTIDIYSQPEWAALVVGDGSDIADVADLAGKKVAATKGTDPYFFLLQSLEEAGVDPADVTIENLQHADGATALSNGSVDAWAGLDPIMAGAEEEGATLLYRNVDFNSYGFLNATEEFLTEKPDVAQTVVDAYEKAREWAEENPEETAQILADVAGLDLAVASTVIEERSNLDVDNVPGQAQLDVLSVIGPILVESGDVASQDAVDEALDALLEPSFAEKADPSALDD